MTAGPRAGVHVEQTDFHHVGRRERELAEGVDAGSVRPADSSIMHSHPQNARSALLVIAILLLVNTAGRTAPVTQDWQWAVNQNLTRERVVGLLNLPEIVGEGCGPQQPQSATLHDMPSKSSPRRGSITFQVTDRQPDGGYCGGARLIVQRTDGSSGEQLPTSESGYEIPAVVVYERSRSWFRIALQRGSAWMVRDNLNDFQPYPELLKDKLSFVRKGWDGKLWRTPGSGTGERIPAAWGPYLADGIGVDVLAIQRVGGAIWLRVQLKTESCGETLIGVKSAAGWIPAYLSSGTPSVWFFSRGC